MSRKLGKKAPPYFYDGPPPEKEERIYETEDIYNTDERDEMLYDDEITAAEEGFMRGHQEEAPSKKQTLRNSINHTDGIADELAKEDAEED
ncbi:MAG: hypothetical protein LBH74_10240 [Nitrososphaerota archaeon]|jgi:hypothetical protein|nr:hypothetical protein [Nitrososphaerota archaeon]